MIVEILGFQDLFLDIEKFGIFKIHLSFKDFDQEAFFDGLTNELIMETCIQNLFSKAFDENLFVWIFLTPTYLFVHS